LNLGPTVLVDYPGLGGAPIDPSIKSASDLYVKVMTSLPESFDLVALSMASLFAFRAAIEEPWRIHRMVLIAPTGGVDLQRFGANDWRNEWRSRRPDGPTWLVEDRTDVSGQLGKINVPTRLIFGDRDRVSPMRFADFLLAQLRQVDLRIVLGGTHDLESEYPDIAASFVDSHLRGV
jgi:poly(3-hydroxyoctanoate) depolymerase